MGALFRRHPLPVRTPDMGGYATSHDFTRAVLTAMTE